MENNTRNIKKSVRARAFCGVLARGGSSVLSYCMRCFSSHGRLDLDRLSDITSSKGAKSSQTVTEDINCERMANDKIEPELSRTQHEESEDKATAEQSSSFGCLPTEILLMIIGQVDDFFDRHFLRLSDRRIYSHIPSPFAGETATHQNLLFSDNN